MPEKIPSPFRGLERDNGLLHKPRELRHEVTVLLCQSVGQHLRGRDP